MLFFTEQYQQADLQAHLQQLKQYQEIQHHNYFFGHKDDRPVPLSEQGWPSNYIT